MLLDSSGLLCLLDRSEGRHADAVSLYQHAAARWTHNYVLAEFVALTIARRVPRERALDFVASLSESESVEVVWVGEQLHRAALALLRDRLDKDWSLCDAVSFALMRERNETDALTTDHHFEQAGFVRLLKR